MREMLSKKTLEEIQYLEMKVLGESASPLGKDYQEKLEEKYPDPDNQLLSVLNSENRDG